VREKLIFFYFIGLLMDQWVAEAMMLHVVSPNLCMRPFILGKNLNHRSVNISRWRE
jgi:hypothetical protein